MKRAQACRAAFLGAAISSLAVLVLLGVAAASPVTVAAGNLLIRISGHISPKALPRTRLAPVGFEGSASVATRDGSHIPAALGTHLLVDRHIRLDTTGLKTCRLSQIEARSPEQAKKACGGALIGEGTSSAQVQFEESAPFEAKGPLLAFNGPATGGGGYGGGGYNEQLYYVYANVPVPTALIAVGKVTRAGGKYGYAISISIPTIAGGAGSFSGAEFKIDRKWTYEGRRHSFLSAECTDGHLDAQVEVKFVDGSHLEGKVVNPCQSSG
jgi:hypothetical protein